MHEYIFSHQGETAIATPTFLDNGCYIYDITREDGTFIANVTGHPLQDIADTITAWQMNQARIRPSYA